MTYINCGNEAPLLLGKGGSITALMPTGPVLGVIPDASFAVRETKVEVNDLLLAFTDGIPDALNAENNSFGNERLKRLLNDENRSPKALLDNIEEQLHQFMGGAEQFDDITMLAVKRLH